MEFTNRAHPDMEHWLQRHPEAGSSHTRSSQRVITLSGFETFSTLEFGLRGEALAGAARRELVAPAQQRLRACTLC